MTARAWLMLGLATLGCAGAGCAGDRASDPSAASTGTSSASTSVTPSSASGSVSTTSVTASSAGHAGGSRDSTASSARMFPFAWRPPRGDRAAYEMSDPDDQHHLLFTAGVERGGSYPVVIAFHGQPHRGAAPRSYAFPKTVASEVNALRAAGEVTPLVVALPVFRFAGVEWPGFDLLAFRSELERLLARESITASAYLLFGHSGAAGCGGGGLNGAARIEPRAVAFLDTCVGASFARAVGELQQHAIPTLILHSVETSGFVPRQPPDSGAHFDYGRIYRPLGLEPSACPERLPDAPLRDQPFRCAADRAGVVHALVVDTGEGELGHEALVPVGVRYFLRLYAAPP